MFFIKIFISVFVLLFLTKPQEVIQIIKQVRKIKKLLKKNTINIKNKTKKMFKKQFNIDIDKICLKIKTFQQNNLLQDQKVIHFVEKNITQDNIVDFQKIIKDYKKLNKK